MGENVLALQTKSAVCIGKGKKLEDTILMIFIRKNMVEHFDNIQAQHFENFGT